MMLITSPRQTVRLPGRNRKCKPPSPVLRLTPYAWAKLIYLRDEGPTEVGGFGVSHPDDLLLIEDICLVQQKCTGMTVAFEDASVADYFDAQVDQGRLPEAFARIWVHTHPGSSPAPSHTDEATFARCFGGADWAIMLILACGGRTYARLRSGTDPVANLLLPVELDFSRPFPAAAPDAWDSEYQRNVSLDDCMFDPRREYARADRLADGQAERDLCFQAPACCPRAASHGWEVCDA
jgi:proteasome lid subunit RPN8/RPN11